MNRAAPKGVPVFDHNRRTHDRRRNPLPAMGLLLIIGFTGAFWLCVGIAIGHAL